MTSIRSKTLAIFNVVIALSWFQTAAVSHEDHDRPFFPTGRRNAICAEPTSVLMAMRVNPSPPSPNIVVPESENQLDFILEAFENHFLLRCLDQAEKKQVAKAMNEEKFNDGDYVYRKGDDGRLFYVLSQAEADGGAENLDQEANVTKTYKVGNVFGDNALVNDCKRAESIRAKGAISVWARNRSTYRSIIAAYNQHKQELEEEDNANDYSSFNSFSLPDNELDDMSDSEENMES